MSEPSAAPTKELPAPVRLSDAATPYHHRLKQFEQTLGPAVLKEKVRGYERELVSMMAEDARFRETIVVKETHVRILENLLDTWSTTTVAERREVGDYYTQEDVKDTLQRQKQAIGKLRSTLHCLEYEVETVRRRISLTWEMFELAERNEGGLAGRRDGFYMVAGGSNEHRMQFDR